MRNSLQLSDLVKSLRRVCASDLVGQSETTVLLALLLHADGDGQCFPSLDRLARFSKVHRTTVVRVLEKLRCVGLVDWEPGGGRSRSNEYRLEIDELLTLPETVAPCDRFGEVVENSGGNCEFPVENAGVPVENSCTTHNKPSHDARETVAPCDTNGSIERDQLNENHHRRAPDAPLEAPGGAPYPPPPSDPRTGNGERGTGIAERGTWNGERASQNENEERNGTERAGAVVADRRNPPGSRGSGLPAAGSERNDTPATTRTANALEETLDGHLGRPPDAWEWLTVLTHIQPTPAIRLIVRQAREYAATIAGSKGGRLTPEQSAMVETFALRQIAAISGFSGMTAFAESTEPEVFAELRSNFGIPPLFVGGEGLPHGR
jgi:hypothetical protein